MKTLIIAEIGVNHNGSFKLAKKLIYIAKNAGADLVKFQVFKSDDLVTKQASVAEYQKKTKSDRTHLGTNYTQFLTLGARSQNNIC